MGRAGKRLLLCSFSLHDGAPPPTNWVLLGLKGSGGAKNKPEVELVGRDQALAPVQVLSPPDALRPVQ